MGVDQRLGQVSLNSMNVQYLAVLHGLLKQVRFPFILTCSYYYAYKIYHTKAWD